MIITSRNELYYKIEMTALQTYHIQMFLEAIDTDHIDEFSLSTKYEPDLVDEIRGTLKDLKIALEKR